MNRLYMIIKMNTVSFTQNSYQFLISSPRSSPRALESPPLIKHSFLPLHHISPQKTSKVSEITFTNHYHQRKGREILHSHYLFKFEESLSSPTDDEQGVSSWQNSLLKLSATPYHLRIISPKNYDPYHSKSFFFLTLHQMGGCCSVLAMGWSPSAINWFFDLNFQNSILSILSGADSVQDNFCFFVCLFCFAQDKACKGIKQCDQIK